MRRINNDRLLYRSLSFDYGNRNRLKARLALIRQIDFPSKTFAPCEQSCGAFLFRAGESKPGRFSMAKRVSGRRSTCRAVVCPSALAGFKGAAALLPVGVDIRLDIHFVCPPPIRPMAFPMTPAHGRVRKVPLTFSRKRTGEVSKSRQGSRQKTGGGEIKKSWRMDTPSLTNGYCIPDRSPLGLHPSGHPAKHKRVLMLNLNQNPLASKCSKVSQTQD